ncbi:MAG TPA: A24 family peptidase [Candidatus Binatia bacterium]|nr:A24 family peptidase [Candidatus Binatia bacterium]
MRVAAAGGLALALAWLAFGRFGATWRWGALLPVLAALAAIVVTDLSWRRIPDAITLPGTAYGVALAVLLPGHLSLAEAVLGVAAGGGVVLLLAMLSGGKVGGGDIKLTAMLGSVLGWKQTLVVFALSQVLGGAVALALLAARVRGPRDGLPIGSLIAILGALFLIGGP